MNSSNDPQPAPDKSAQLEALLELWNDVEASEWKNFSHYWSVLLLILGYGIGAWLQSRGNQPDLLGLFLAVIVIMFTLQGVNERREKRRWKLLLEFLRKTQH